MLIISGVAFLRIHINEQSSVTTKKSYECPKQYGNLSSGWLEFDSNRKKKDAVLVVLIRCLVMLTLRKNKPNTIRLSESIPFSLHGSWRGLGFSVSTDTLSESIPFSLHGSWRGLGFSVSTDNCTLIDMMYWETGDAEIWKILKK